MSKFKQYKIKQIAELREITEEDVKHYENNGVLYTFDTEEVYEVSISDVDLRDGSPKVGDMVARNPKNHNDQWLVAKQYFEDNFELVN